MRKFFTLIGAALLSIAAMHATSFTQDIDLSVFQMYTSQGKFDASTLEFSELVAWGGGQIWYGDDANALAVGDYTHICMDLAEVADNDVYLGIEYTKEDGHSTQSLTIAAGKKNAILQLTGASIKKIEIKNWSDNADASFTLSGVYFYKVIGKEETHTLYSGSYSLANWDWDSRLQIANTLFASAHDGDKIIITYNSEANADPNYVGAHVRVGETNATFTYVDEDEVITESQTGATYTFILRDADVAGVQAKGMYINGKKIVITKVELVTYSQQVMVERTLNTGSETLDWNQHWIHQGDLPTLSAGDELRITVSGVESGQYWQVNFRHNDSGEDAITFGSSDETTPKVYSFALTAEQAININNGKLLIVGCNVTLSRFALAQPQSIYDAAWRDEKTYDDSWSVNEVIAADKFAGLSVGDMIAINISALENGGQVRLLHDWTPFAPEAVYVFNATHASPMTVSFVVNQEMRDAILADGIRVCGVNFTMTEVYVLEADARTERYTLTVSDAGMATLVLPFNVPTLPDGVTAYTLSNEGSNVIDATEVSALRGDKPVLIIAEAGEYVFTSELGGNADISGKNHWPVESYVNEALVGNYAPTLWVPYTGQPNGNNYILQNGAEGVGFYKVTNDDECTLAPYRAYLSCGYNALAAGAPMRIRFKHDVVTATENVAEEGNVQKLLRDGQLLIRRGENMYTIQGQIVK